MTSYHRSSSTSSHTTTVNGVTTSSAVSSHSFLDPYGQHVTLEHQTVRLPFQPMFTRSQVVVQPPPGGLQDSLSSPRFGQRLLRIGALVEEKQLDRVPAQR